ncbi:Myb-like domain-containing protein [Psidium guajava]|nr:Myb-like domain-containing protein [Psidium guajava]
MCRQSRMPKACVPHDFHDRCSIDDKLMCISFRIEARVSWR